MVYLRSETTLIKTMILRTIILNIVVVCCFALPTQAQFPGEEFTGKASFYHKKFNNKKTSCGEIFHNDNLTAAHRSLPFGSLIEVTNTANNQSVIVRVNDRGPFAHNRLVDLSQSAAQQLDMLSTGTADVIVKIVMIPTPTGPLMLLPAGFVPVSSTPTPPVVVASTFVRNTEFPQHEPIKVDSSGGRLRVKF
jgi:rare lipoprotein A